MYLGEFVWLCGPVLTFQSGQRVKHDNIYYNWTSQRACFVACLQNLLYTKN